MMLPDTWTTRTEESNPRNTPYGLVGIGCMALIWPDVESPRVLSGFWKFGWLNTLYAWAPIPSWTPSVTLKVLNRPMSISKKRGPVYWLRRCDENPGAVKLVPLPPVSRKAPGFKQGC